MARKKTDSKSACPVANPCLIVKRRWSRLAKMFVDTNMTLRETATAYCVGKNGRLTTASYCTGDHCSVTVDECKQPLETIGYIHTHPSVPDPNKPPIPPVEMRAAIDQHGDIYHSHADLRLAINWGAKFSCVFFRDGKGECLSFKSFTEGERKALEARLRTRQTGYNMKEEDAFLTILTGRCELDTRGKQGGKWRRCQ